MTQKLGGYANNIQIKISSIGYGVGESLDS